MQRKAGAAIAVVLAAPAAGATMQQDFAGAIALPQTGNAAGAARQFAALLKQMPRAAGDPHNHAAALVRAGLGSARLTLGDAEAAVGAHERAVTHASA